jgi:hypothetical protein
MPFEQFRSGAMRKKAKVWYVIADGGKARFVERDKKGVFRTVASFVSTELHKRTSDLGRDKPTRAHESATPTRHAIEPRRDLKEASKADFVKIVAEQIDAEHERGPTRSCWSLRQAC